MKTAKPSIIFADDAMVVVNKPSGLLSVPDRYDPELPHVGKWLSRELGQVWPVHRLDRDTSGLMVFARNEEAHRHLNGQFADGRPSKAYFALVEGKLTMEEGELTYPLAAHPGKVGRVVVSNKGKEAKTSFRVLEWFRSCSWVEAQLHTGRTHQIRVHFQAFGHPLVADPFYGQRTEFYLSSFKKKKYRPSADRVERPLLSRTALHAARLTIDHPHTGESMTWEADLPKDLSASLNQLRKWDQT